MKLSLQQKVLWYWALYNDDTSGISYQKDAAGTKSLSKTLRTKEEEIQLLKKFYDDPKTVLAYCRSTLKRIASDTKLSDTEKKERSERYIGQYLDFIIQLDKEAFVHDPKKIYDWIPDYIPDGFVDMWSDYRLDTNFRNNREKIIVRKNDIFWKERELLYKILSSPSMSKKDMISHIFYEVSKKEYNHNVAKNWLWWKSINLDKIIDDDLLVCRHKALLFQILAQACWFTSRLLKCDVFFPPNTKGPHAANLIRLDNKRYLLDATIWTITTNENKKKYCIVPIPQNEIDLNTHKYDREIETNNKKLEYTSRNNLFYQIR